MAEENSFVYGIIHIGSSSLSMRIVEYKDADTIRVIEEVRKETTFGEEVFINKKLSFTSIRRLCDMLNGLKQLLRDYCVTDYKVYGILCGCSGYAAGDLLQALSSSVSHTKKQKRQEI
jgi:exopolyphosphatase/guanosine-5'-triphosphate,3'-diphosphate pyrophosphatase